jgi:hypothetical protein
MLRACAPAPDIERSLQSMAPLVSVILPVRNRAWVARAVTVRSN